MSMPSREEIKKAVKRNKNRCCVIEIYKKIDEEVFIRLAEAVLSGEYIQKEVARGVLKRRIAIMIDDENAVGHSTDAMTESFHGKLMEAIDQVLKGE